MPRDTVISVDPLLADASSSADIEAIAVDPPGKRLAVGMAGRLVVYSLADGVTEEYVLVDVVPHVPTRILFMADGNHIIANTVQQMSNSDSVESVLVLGDKKKKPLLAVPGVKALESTEPGEVGGGVSAWAVSSTGVRLATAWEPQGVAVWNLSTRKRERIVIKSPGPDADPLDVSALAFSPDGDEIAVLMAGAIEIHPCAKGKRIARIEIDETFGASRIAFTPDGIVWARCAPGVCETSVVDIRAGTVARRPIALERVQPLRLDATSVLWLQETGEGESREQILVRQGLHTGQLDPIARTPAPDSPRVHLAINATGDTVARIDGRTVRVTPIA